MGEDCSLRAPNEPFSAVWGPGVSWRVLQSSCEHVSRFCLPAGILEPHLVPAAVLNDTDIAKPEKQVGCWSFCPFFIILLSLHILPTHRPHQQEQSKMAASKMGFSHNLIAYMLSGHRVSDVFATLIFHMALAEPVLLAELVP